MEAKKATVFSFFFSIGGHKGLITNTKTLCKKADMSKEGGSEEVHSRIWETNKTSPITKKWKIH